MVYKKMFFQYVDIFSVVHIFLEIEYSLEAVHYCQSST